MPTELTVDRVAGTFAPTPGRTLEEVAELGCRLRASVQTVMRVRPEVLDVVLATLLAGGHLLVEDHPGLGKTQLARTVADCIGGRFARVQGTADLLPADIVGANIWRPEAGIFEFRPGPVFANVVLVDELNRTTPKTQSGLLEAMQEGRVTVDGQSRPVPVPFTVIATQNPTAGHDGTYPLPLAQLDRFLAKVSLGYPTPDGELSLLYGGADRPAVPVCEPAELLSAQQAVGRVHTSEPLLRYVVNLLAATRMHPMAEIGASPRAGLLLTSAARALAALRGRDHVLIDDVQFLARPVLAHRIRPAAAAPPEAPRRVIADAVASVVAR